MTNVTPPISLAGSRLGDTRHVCAFFHSDDEEYRVLLPFIKDGFHCLQRNPFYLPPQQLLPGLRERRAKQASRAAGVSRGHVTQTCS